MFCYLTTVPQHAFLKHKQLKHVSLDVLYRTGSTVIVSACILQVQVGHSTRQYLCIPIQSSIALVVL